MSFVERALEQLKPEPAVARTNREEPATPSDPQVDSSPRKHGRVEAADVADAIRPMPCRADRTVSIEFDDLRAAGVIAPEEEWRRIGEEYRLIKRPLLKTMTGEGSLPLGNVVVVTSAVPGEGKTFTSVNLALSLARERNREVILIDGDVAKRHVTRLFGLEDEAGFLDLGGATHCNFADVVFRTSIPSLYLLPAGNPHVEATEILRSERIASLLKTLASEPRRIVLIDSPPLLATSEAGVLASLAGQVIMVVKASETPQEIIARAIESIPEDRPVSLILNQVVSVPERSYGYYDYYGSYGRSQDSVAANPADTEDSR